MILKKHLINQTKALLSHRRRSFLSGIDQIFDKTKLQDYREKGYTILPNVFSAKYLDELKQEIDSLIENADIEEIKSVFEVEKLQSDDYFIDSGDKIRFFLEKDAFDEEGNLRGPLKDSLNKIGHALHDINPKFKEFSYSDEVKDIVRKLGYISPILVQSMYIFKNKKIGGEVTPHTDNIYLRTSPSSCTGIWVAFDDAKVENGCMWGIPGSHMTPTNYFLKLGKDERGNKKVFYDPPTPPEYDIDQSVPLEASKGSVIILHGDFVHFSNDNKSDQQRHAYTLHFVESRGHIWEADNWLQRRDLPFNFLYDTQTKI